MDKPMSNAHFVGMSLIFKIRDAIRPPELVLSEAGIQPGFRVLDYGCGPGSLTIAAARQVGESGEVFALDIHPKAIEKVKERASAEGLDNVRAVLADSPAKLENEQFDVVLLYDIFHMLSDQESVLRQLHRILKPNAVLSFSDHHMKKDAILDKMSAGGLFKLKEHGRRTYAFVKVARAHVDA